MKQAAKDAAWAEAKKRCRLNEADIRMAKELGMSPNSLIKNIPSPSQKWKASVQVWIRELYEHKFGKVLTNGGNSVVLTSGGNSVVLTSGATSAMQSTVRKTASGMPGSLTKGRAEIAAADDDDLPF